MKTGINKLAGVVKTTMGPNGQNVIINKDGLVAITKDGVSVAMEVDLADYVENVSAQLIKQVAHKTVLETGDGTTTATVLAEAIFEKGLIALKDGANPRDLFAGIEAGIKTVVQELSKISVKADTFEILKNIATISANGDEEVGEWIAQAFEEVGHTGLVRAEISRDGVSDFEIVKGLDFASGYVIPQLLDDVNSGEITYERPLIFLYDTHVKVLEEVMPVLEYSTKQLAKDGKPSPIVIIATGFDASLFQTLVKSKVAGLIRPMLIKAPGNGDSQLTFFGDLAVATGAKLISAKLGQNIKNLTNGDLIAQHVGSCERITITSNQTKVYEGAGSEEAINAYVAKLQEIVDADGPSESAKFIIRERISRLSKGMAVIHVGADSEVAAREKYERVDDAIGATKAAIAEGYVPGGGHALLYVRQRMIDYTNFGPKGYVDGYEVVREAIKAPFETIVKNSGRDIQSVMSMVAQNRVNQSVEQNFGYDARNHKAVDLIETGIIDPTKVTRCALQNAASIASLMLNSSTLMVKTPEKGPGFNMQL